MSGIDQRWKSRKDLRSGTDLRSGIDLRYGIYLRYGMENPWDKSHIDCFEF